jgi:hypothetical protein
MKGFSISGRPSPAIIVAILALVFALAGSAVAGTAGLSNKVTRSTVKKIAAKQANKVVDQRAASLSVAKAERATTATNADNAAKAEHANSADIAADVADLNWEDLELKNGWAAAGGGAREPLVAEGPAGVVYFQGAITRTSGTSDNPFKLEPELRPDGLVSLTADQENGATGRIYFGTDGEVTVQSDPEHATAGSNFTSLDGISYVP